MVFAIPKKRHKTRANKKLAKLLEGFYYKAMRDEKAVAKADRQAGYNKY